MKKLLLSLVAMVFAIGVNATEVVFDLSSASAYGYANPEKGSFTQIGNGESISKDGVSIKAAFTSGNGLRFYSNGTTGVINLRAYKGSSFEICAPSGSKVTSINISGTNLGSAYVTGTNYNNGKWTGSAESVKLDVIQSTAQMNTITVVLDGDEPQPIDPEGTGEGTVGSPYDVKRALSIIKLGIYTENKVYVKGKISKIESIDTGEYGNATYFISDDGTESAQLEIFRGYYYNGNRFTTGNEIKVGDEVVVCGALTLYGTTSEMTSGSSIYTINGKPYEKPEYKPVGDGSIENPYTVEDIVGMEIKTSDGNKYWVKGYIIGCASSKDKLAEGDNIGDTNIALGATATATSFIPVALPTNDVRKTLGIKTNPGNVGKEVMVYGTLEAYFTTAGVKNVSEYVIIDPASINNIKANAINTPIINLNGQIVSKDYKGVIVKNGKKFISK